MEWPVLSQLSESDARDLLATAQRRTFAKGEVVFHGGAPADALHLIREGRFAIRVITPLGDSAILTVVDARVLRRVHDLPAIYGAGDDPTAVIPLTQEDIANLAGTSRATVNRVLREQERNGILELGRGQTVVTDREALALLAR